MISRTALAVLISLLGSISGEAGEPTSLQVTDTAVVVTNGLQKLTASLADGTLGLVTPYRDYRFAIHIDQDSEWIRPSHAMGKPVVKRTRSSVHAVVTYPVPGGRELELTIDAYRGVPAVFVTSRVRVLGDCRPEYYFWSWPGTFDHYFVPGESGPERREVDTKTWSRFGFHDWVFLPAASGGLAVLTTGTVGRAPGDGGDPYINALPRSGYIGKGRSLDVSFGIAGVKNALEAAALWQLASRRRIGAIDRSPARAPSPKIDYGKPAPPWLREADLYNGFYHAKPAWSRETIRDRLSDIPLIVGVPHDRALIDRCHRAGIRVIAYVNYMELLNTRIEQEAKGGVYYEWLQAVDHDALDLANHPDWVCVDADGKDVSSIWGSNNGHPGLFYTCFHQQSLRDAALEQVRKLMEMGADGVFLDNAGPVVECFGGRLGKHRHAEEVPNTRMYQRLQQDIYELVKSYGEDRIVMINSGIIPEYWAWCDAQMWESCYCGAGTPERMHEWPELQYAGELHSEAVRQGKVPVILSYLGDQPDDARGRGALFTYAYARLYGFLWADWFTLEKTESDRKLAKALYQARLGKPAGVLKQDGKVFYREFEKGLVIVNPTARPVSAVIPTRLTSPLADVGHSGTITPSNGRLKIEIAAESGRVLTVANGILGGQVEW